VALLSVSVRSTVLACAGIACVFLAVDAPVAHAADSFSFAVTADPRAEGPSWQNALREIRDMTVNPEPAFAPPSWVIVAGDIDPARRRFEDYNEIFTNALFRPPLLPVIGNHDVGFGGFEYIRDVIIPAIPGAFRRQPESCDYYIDYRNVRLVVVDAYTKSGKEGVIRGKGRKWVESVIRSAPTAIDHIFVSFHEPAFPRGRHVTDSFNSDVEQRNAFWRMLLSSGGRVRAVFVGHTHTYSRLRVRDPESPAASDLASFPDEPGGIYQVDAGAAGHGDTNTFVRVQVEGKNLFFRTYKACNGAGQPFSECDRWQVPQKP